MQCLADMTTGPKGLGETDKRHGNANEFAAQAAGGGEGPVMICVVLPRIVHLHSPCFAKW